MEYRTVFDVATAGYKSWSLPAHGLVLIVAGIIVTAFRNRFPGWRENPPRPSKAFSFSFLGFAVLWTLASFFFTYKEYFNLSAAREANRVSVVEGVVTNFKPMPYAGHAKESFCVSGKCFEYSDYMITAGFNNTSSHGGPIREGLPVRITYVGRSIVKLEVSKSEQ